MGGFEISEELNADKAFLVNHSDLINRIDPCYYKGTFHNLRKKLIAKNFVRLSTFVDSWNRGDGPRDGFYTENSKLGVYFLRVNNLQKHTIELEDVKYINRIIHETKLKRTQVTAGDVVFAISGTKDNLGTVSIIPNNIHEANLNSALVRFDLNKRIDKKFFCILFDLNFVRTQIEFTGKGAAQNNLNNDEISSFLLPNLDLSTQKSLVKNYEAAQQKQQQKQQQAQALLDSIDTYLLNELGITLPEHDSSLEKRMFTVRFTEMTSGRVDPYYFQEHFVDFFKSLNQSKYEVLPLSKVSKKIASGITPLSGGDAYTSSDEGIPFVRSGNINIDGAIDFSDLIYLKSSIHNTLMKSSKLLKNDLMIAIVGATIGQVGIYINNREANINQAIALVRLKEGINHQYMKELIKSGIGQMSLNRLKRPVARANINLEEISTMQIILPPLKKQNEIATHITKIRTQAKQLQTEAAQILDNAKAEIERIILGKI
jgi:restriction endonuclease S subunit